MTQTIANQSPGAAPADLRPAVDGLIDIASHLIALLGRETALLREMKTNAIGELQPEKLRLVRAYEERTRGLNARGEELGKVDRAIRDELRATVGRFEDAAKANAIAIHAAREANERLMQAIVDVLNERRNRADRYGANGVRSTPEAGPNDGVALALDERL